MPAYPSEHGDVFILADTTRQQLAFNAHGTNYTIQPNVWYMLGTTQAVYKGYAIAILTTNPITVGIADQNSVAAIIGVALNTVTSPSSLVTLSGSSIDTTDLHKILMASTTGIVSGMMVSGIGIPINTFVASVSNNTYIILNNAPSGYTNLTFGTAIEVASEGPFNFTSAVFNASDIGLPLYMYPAASTTFTGPGTISPPTTQLTTSHSLASASGQPILEVGVCTSIYSMLIDLQGDVRGASGLSQVSVNAGEAIPNIATPLVVSMGSDGYAYVADKRKSSNILAPKLLLGTNSSGLTLQQATPQTTMATFTVTHGATSGGSVVQWGGGASGNVTVSASDDMPTVALDIITSAPSGWVITSQGPNVTMVKTGIQAAPTIAPGNGVTFSAISTTFTYSQYTLTLSGTANGGSIVIHGLSITPTTGHTSNQAASDIVTAINLSTNGLSTTWLASSSTNIVTLTSIVNTNRNTPVGFLIGANSGFSNTYASGTGSAGGSIAKILWIPDLGYFVGLVSGSSNAAYYSIDGINWAATGNLPSSGNWMDLAWSPSLGTLVAISQTTAGAYFVSASKTWSSMTLSSPGGGSWWAVKWSPSLNLFVAIANGSTATSYSSTGTGTWSTGGTFTTTTQWGSLEWSPDLGKFVATSLNAGRSAYSTSGLTWTESTAGLPSGGTKSIKWSSTLGLFVALAQTTNGTISVASSDGINWQQYTGLPAAGASSTWSSLEWCPDRLVFVAISNYAAGTPILASSIDGKVWTQITGTGLANLAYTSISWSSTLQAFSIVSSTTTPKILYYNGLINPLVSCIIQKVGIITGLTGLIPGLPVYAYNAGGYTTNLTSLSYYNDISSPLGYVSSSTSIYINVGYNTQKTDGNQIGAIIAKPSTLDYGWLTCDGSAISRSTYSDLFNVVGITYGSGDGSTTFNLPTSGSVAYFTITHNASGSTGPLTWGGGASGTVTITNGDSIATVANKIAASPPIGWSVVSDGVSLITMVYSGTVIAPTLAMGSTAVTISAINFTSSTSPWMEIKYLNWYLANPVQAPTFRYDSGWGNWGLLPLNSGCLGTNWLGGTPTWIDVPATAFGQTVDFTSMFAEVYITQSGTGTWKIDPNPIQVGANYYGYQLQLSPTTGYIRVNFATNGLAYLNGGNTYTPITYGASPVWQYRIFIYQTQRYNRYYDYTADTKLSQLWSMALVDFTTSVNTQGVGYFDRSTTQPSGTTRLNYNGDLYFTDGYITNSLTIINNNLTVSTGNIIVSTGYISVYSNITTVSNTLALGGANTLTMNIGISTTTTINIGSNSTPSTTNLYGTTNIPSSSTFTISGASNISLGSSGSAFVSSTNTLTVFSGAVTLNIGSVATSVINLGSTSTLAISAPATTVNLFSANVTALNIGSTSTIITIPGTTSSSSSITGAFIVTGGVGIGGNLYVGGNLSITGTCSFGTAFTSVISTSNTTVSTSTTTGALVVAGGAGIGGNLYVNNFVNYVYTAATSFTALPTSPLTAAQLITNYPNCVAYSVANVIQSVGSMTLTKQINMGLNCSGSLLCVYQGWGHNYQGSLRLNGVQVQSTSNNSGSPVTYNYTLTGLNPGDVITFYEDCTDTYCWCQNFLLLTNTSVLGTTVIL